MGPAATTSFLVFISLVSVLSGNPTAGKISHHSAIRMRHHTSHRFRLRFVAALGCRMRMPEKAVLWWDREADYAGRPIRSDVRIAAHEIWEEACRRTDALLADRAQAADLMESSVAQVSRYLDRIGAPTLPSKQGLLMLAFCRALRKQAIRMSRLEFVGGSFELSARIADENWMSRANCRLDLERVLRQLSIRNAKILLLRAAGYTWKEIADLLGTSAARVRNGFWREVRKALGNRLWGLMRDRCHSDLKWCWGERTGRVPKDELLMFQFPAIRNNKNGDARRA
jgi:DNA-directed RNA polymerase specialized sigma24 family protein